MLVASPKQVNEEARFFVVDGRVVAGSTYRVHGRVLYRSVDSSNPLYLPLRQFAEWMAREWQPAEAFVLDVARMGPEFKDLRVVEVNCLNSSGFYDANMLAVVKAIENLHDWPERW